MKFEISLLFLINTGSAVGYSLVAPLFPSVALDKGISEEIIGAIMASYAIANVLITPFYRNILNFTGKKNGIFIGLFIEVKN
jgi:MFS family permease